MPPVVGVRIFSGTSHFKKALAVISYASVPSPFLYRVCIVFRAAVSVFASVWTKLLFLKLESVRPKNWYGHDLSRCQIASAVSLLYRIFMHCTTFHRLEQLSSHQVNRGTLCGNCFPQLIKICLARILLPRCLDPSRHAILLPDSTVWVYRHEIIWDSGKKLRIFSNKIKFLYKKKV